MKKEDNVEWEMVDETRYRKMVYGGWLIRYVGKLEKADPLFVKDVDHKWKLQNS